MSWRKTAHFAVLIGLALTLLVSGSAPALARPAQALPVDQPGASTAPAGPPTSPVDESKVPHYFGPWPNWANSPFTLPDVTVTIDPPGGAGTQATATASVGANGALTGITITDPGSGYTSVPAVAITGAGTGAAAHVTVTGTGAVTSITVGANGGGYTAPVVTITGAATTPASATAYGGVDAVAITNGGLGYTMPVVDFDSPDDPNGTIAKAHAEIDANGTITAVVVDDPGSGYAAAPKVVIHDGPVYAPINNRQLKAGYAARDEATSLDKTRRPSNRARDVSPAATTDATAAATLKILSVTVDVFGAGYAAAPAVAIDDTAPGTGAGATATAQVDLGAVTSIIVDTPGSGYVTATGVKKFIDPLPGLCNPAVAGSCAAVQLDAGGAPLAIKAQPKYIPLGVPVPVKYNGIESDQYEVGLVQYRTNFSSSLKDANGTVGTLVRGYVQLDKGCTALGTGATVPGSQCFPLTNELLNGTQVPILKGDGTQWFGVTPPQWLGPTLAATKDKPVRIIFRNLLPTGYDGNLFLPVDSTLMGSGMGPTGMWTPAENGSVLDEVRNPLCTDPGTYPAGKIGMCYKDNRQTLHLHGGLTPWISDGTPHQWITPASENTPWPQGVSVRNVPDMPEAGCDAANDGCMTFYYTNQQSARLMFYHDHAYGITRLNVAVGGAAGYLISDSTEAGLIASGAIPGADATIPLIVQDRTFVPSDQQLYDQIDANGNVTSYGQDPTWDKTHWGGYGNIWNHHVYMPAQNPGDPSGMSAYGRWMYGPWFWPPAANTVYGPIANPYYNKDAKGPDGKRGTADDFTTAKVCDLNDPSTWQYDTDPFCEPAQIPGTPNISVGMEQFNDTPVVNGIAYPTITLEPKTYRFRMLNAANDRFFNFQWYVGDPSTADAVLGPTEVAFNEAELAAAQTDPNIFPTPDTSDDQGTDPSYSLPGPDWVQIGSEGGFLPAPAVVDGQQVTTWITDPTRFDVGNVDKHSLLIAPAERADVIVDFSQFAGQTLILYNDAPAAFPARVASYDYYTGAPDLSPVGAPGVLPGYGPNTRTIMQVKIAGTPASAFNLAKLQNAFKHHADGSGAFESGQHPIIVGQSPYNSAYGASFAAAGDCSTSLTGATRKCDGLVRVADTAAFNFNTLKAQSTVMNIPLQPKAIHDEMNSTTFDEYGRMQATLGMEAQPPSPGVQNVTLYPYVNPGTEIIDGTNLPKNIVTFDATTGLPVSDLKITAISNAADGTQIWRITHNGVDTHPIHFHLFDVQLLNRVTWDNIIIPNDPNELGWKDTVRVSPLEDTIVALRPIIPQLPWEIPNAIRDMNPAMPEGATAAFNNVDPAGNPTNPIVNQLVNFGWEYVYHCHILSHEEMDMMRPVSAVLPPLAPSFPASPFSFTGTGPSRRIVVSFNDNSITETSFLVQRSADGTTWVDAGTVTSPLNAANVHQVRSFTDPTANASMAYLYRVVARNTVGYGNEFPSLTATSMSGTAIVNAPTPPTAPTTLVATLEAGPQIALRWLDTATNESGFIIERSTNGGAYTQIATAPARNNVGLVNYTDTTVTYENSYTYRVAATNLGGTSSYAVSNTVVIPALPAAPTAFTATNGPNAGTLRTVILRWTDNATNETGFTIQRATNASFTTGLNTQTVAAAAGTGLVSVTQGGLARNTRYWYRIRANNGVVSTAWVDATPSPIRTNP